MRSLRSSQERTSGSRVVASWILAAAITIELSELAARAASGGSAIQAWTARATGFTSTTEVRTVLDLRQLGFREHRRRHEQRREWQQVECSSGMRRWIFFSARPAAGGRQRSQEIRTASHRPITVSDIQARIAGEIIGRPRSLTAADGGTANGGVVLSDGDAACQSRRQINRNHGRAGSRRGATEQRIITGATSGNQRLSHADDDGDRAARRLADVAQRISDSITPSTLGEHAHGDERFSYSAARNRSAARPDRRGNSAECDRMNRACKASAKPTSSSISQIGEAEIS